jgi:hypothetical protein
MSAEALKIVEQQKMKTFFPEIRSAKFRKYFT